MREPERPRAGRRLLWPVLIAASLLLSSCVTGRSSRAGSSSSPGGEVASGILYAMAANSGAVQWSVPVGAGSTTPLLYRDSLIVADLAGPEHVGTIRAFDPKTGSEKWVTSLGGGALHFGDGLVPSGASLYGVVVFGDAADQVFAIDIATGHIRWTFARDDAIDGPLVFGRAVAVGLGNAGQVLALDSGSGDPLWAFQAEGTLVPFIVSGQGRLYVSSAPPGRMYALDPSTGVPVWTEPLHDATLLSLSDVDERYVYLLGMPALQPGLEGVALHAIDLQSGREAWRLVRPWLGQGRDLVPANEHVYVLGNDGVGEDPYLLAVDQTGSERWRYSGPYALGPPVAVDGAIYLASHEATASGAGARDTQLVALSAIDGSVRWSAQATGFPTTPPAATPARVYLGTEDGDAGAVVAVDGVTGDELWRRATPKPVYVIPLPTENVLLVATSDRYWS